VNWSDSREPLWENLPERVRTEPEPVDPPEARGHRRRWPIVVAVLFVAMAAWAGWATYAMRENENRALAWQERANALGVRTRVAERRLTERTRTLNDRVDQLNILGARLADAQAALHRSEGDVSSLEVRQRQLADEKAQLEDQAQLLSGVARSYAACKQDLIDLLTDVQTNTDPTASYTAASRSCASADDQLQAYVHAF